MTDTPTEETNVSGIPSHNFMAYAEGTIAQLLHEAGFEIEPQNNGEMISSMFMPESAVDELAELIRYSPFESGVLHYAFNTFIEKKQSKTPVRGTSVKDMTEVIIDTINTLQPDKISIPDQFISAHENEDEAELQKLYAPFAEKLVDALDKELARVSPTQQQPIMAEKFASRSQSDIARGGK